MSVHPPEDRLQDYLDELLCREERAELEQHLAQCEQCRGHVRHERELARMLAELPRELAPARDLLPGIHVRIAAEASAPATARGRGAPWRLRYPLAAAALVLIALTATITTLLRRHDTPSPVAHAEPGPVGPQLLATQRSYDAAAQELLTLVESGGALPVAARSQVSASMRALDAALAETRAALRRDPGNIELARLLDALQQQKLALLRSAARSRRTT